jgi:hypothetical protein
MHHLIPLVLRGTALGALIFLLWNPGSSRVLPADAPPIVLLDASLSMHAGADGAQRWQAAVDSARAAARPRGLLWRFGAGVAAFDSSPPDAGASRLGAALEAAAARGSEVVVVTDGELMDVPTLAADLIQRPRVVILPRTGARDAFVQSIEGPTRVSAVDTVRLVIRYGSAGATTARPPNESTVLTASVAGREIASRRVTLPDSGVLSTELVFPAARASTRAGWIAVEVGLRGAADGEPRDDARLHLMEVSPQPHAVVLATPPSWDSRFFASVLSEVAGVPLRVFVDPGGAATSRAWRDARTLAAVSSSEVSRALQVSRLAVLAGDERRWRSIDPAGPSIRWPMTGPVSAGDWYVDPPPASPIAGRLGGIDWSALPPATGVVDVRPDSGALVALTARLARRGSPRPGILLHERGAGHRSVTILVNGLWRWQFRGGAEAEAFRALVAALADWLLGGDGSGSRRGERFVPVARTVQNGLPIAWRWVGADTPGVVAIRLGSDGDERAVVDTLVFGASGHAESSLPPGVYQYSAVAGGHEAGVVAVETYSDEWRPAPVTLSPQPGREAGRMVTVGARDRWWLFALAIMALVCEWVWRRRQGLP